MSSVFNPRRAMIIVVFILLLMQIESVAGGGWEVRTHPPPKRENGFRDGCCKS